jgi:hypothetical protein
MTKQSEILSLLNLLTPYDPEMKKIRVGSMGDGGYVLPDDLDGIDNVLSIGIGEEDSFDYYFAKNNIPVFQYDHTVDSAKNKCQYYFFNKIALSKSDGEGSRSLSTMIDLHGFHSSNNGILKFDIEGAEWECFSDINSDLLKHFRIIVCELHGISSVVNSEHRLVVRKTLEILLSNHSLVHLHANNCCGIHLLEGIPVPAVVELTLLRNDRSSFTLSKDPIPGALDFPNMADRPDLVLNFLTGK